MLSVPIASYFFTWRYGYTSDHAMSGLLANDIVLRGQHPLFIWSHGYNGVLVESHAIALMFTLFGHGMWQYYFPTLLCFIALCAVFFRHVRARYGLHVAAMATLFFVVSTPPLYFYVMRPQPNYTEIFIIGFALMGCATQWLQAAAGGANKSAPALRVATQPPLDEGAQRGAARPVAAKQRRAAAELNLPESTPGSAAEGASERAQLHWLSAATGFLAGFGLYTYQLILFFIGAIGLWAGVAFLRGLPPRFRRMAGVRRDAYCAAIGLAGLGALTGIVLAVVFFFGSPISPASLRTAARTAFASLAIGIAAELILGFGRTLLRYAQGVFYFALAFAIGFSPRLYYSLYLHGATRDRLQVALSREQVLRTLSLLVQAHRRFLNAWETPFDTALGLVRFGLIAAFAFSSYWTLLQVVRSRRSLMALWRTSPLVLLPLVTAPLFCFAAAAEDWKSARWTIAIVFFFALGQAHSLVRWARCGGWHTKIALGVGGLLLAHNGSHLAAALQEDRAKAYCGESLVPELDRRGITRAYADYWYAYAITFATGERIVVQPFYNQYSPTYGPMLDNARRIALIEKPATLRQLPHQLQVGPHAYRRTDAYIKDDLGFVVLDRVD